jgi:hypothetical protein
MPAYAEADAAFDLTRCEALPTLRFFGRLQRAKQNAQLPRNCAVIDGPAESDKKRQS